MESVGAVASYYHLLISTLFVDFVVQSLNLNHSYSTDMAQPPRMSQEQLALFARNKRQLYYNAQHAGYVLPLLSSPLITYNNIARIRSGELWVPKKHHVTEQALCPQPPPKE